MLPELQPQFRTISDPVVDAVLRRSMGRGGTQG
jgi:hypothetical protein